MSNILEETALATRLREGAEGVRRVIESAAAGQGGGVPLKDLARAARLPLPVCSAVRRELEKAGVFERGGGVRLTRKGEALASELGIVPAAGSSCKACGGKRIVIPAEFRPALEELEAAAAGMPTVDVTLDQAYGLPETSLRRALYALECGALAGRDVIFLGDDDLVSIAAALVLKHVFRGGKVPGRLAVVEVDDRINTLIREESARIGVKVECIARDLREPLPAGLESGFHTFFTDPPYTPEGLRLFLSRAASALEKRPGMGGFLSFAHRDPDADVELFRIISEHGFAPVEVIPGFNFYRGAEIIGNTSRMIRLTGGSGVESTVGGAFEGKMYSGELNPTVRVYECAGCGARVEVGAGRGFAVIEKLKAAGCPACKGNTFRLKEKRKSQKIECGDKEEG